MGEKHFPLEAKENSRFTKIFQIIFGILCIAIALFWMVFNFRSLKADTTLWITIIFLIGFGAYQVMAGFGKIKKYIEFEADRIVLKQNSFLPKIYLKPSDLKKIEILPLTICFYLEKNKKFILRFGLNYIEIIEPVKEAVIEFSELNNVPCEIKKEEF